MAIENVMNFIKDTHEKPELKRILDKPKSDFDSKDAKLEYVAKEAKKHGYNFTAKDLKAVLEVPESELSDDNLSNVAGGGVIQDAWNGFKKSWDDLDLKGSFAKDGFKGAWKTFKDWIW